MQALRWSCRAINIVKYYDVWSTVEPKRQELAQGACQHALLSLAGFTTAALLVAAVLNSQSCPLLAMILPFLPLLAPLAANAKLAEANTKLQEVQAKVAALNAQLAELESQYAVRGCPPSWAEVLVVWAAACACESLLLALSTRFDTAAPPHPSDVCALQAAVAEKDSAVAQSEACQRKLDLANRLIAALASGGCKQCIGGGG